MSELVANCPRCGAKGRWTFDLFRQIPTHIEYNWQNHCEAFCVCRSCNRSTVFRLSQKHIQQDDQFAKLSNYRAAVNNIEGYICIKDISSVSPPDYLPSDVESAFREGSACLSIGCFNAAGTMLDFVSTSQQGPCSPKKMLKG